MFAQNQNIPLTPLDKPLRLKVIDGRDSSVGAIIYYAEVDLLIGYYSERIKLYVTKLARYNIILVRVSFLLIGQPIVAQALLVLSLLNSQTLLPF
jgi:hypothetical protein